MSRKNKYIGGIVGADPLPSGSPRPGVSNLAELGADNAFEAPSLDLNFDGQLSSFRRASTSPTAAKANGDQLATDIITCTRSTTATYVDSNGVLQTAGVNVPRVEFDGNGNPLGLLVEEDRTNYLTDSNRGTNQYGNPPASSFNTTGPDGVPSSAIAPQPDSSSDRFEWDIAAGTFSNNEILTLSWHMKPLSGNTPSIYPGEIRLNSFINMSPGTAYEVRDIGNGWERWAAPVTVTDTTSDQTVRLYFGFPLQDGSGGWNNDVAYYGFQLEEGEAATSYIPNTATSGTVTRTADDITLSTSAFGTNRAASTVFVDFSVGKTNVTYPGAFRIDDGSNTNNSTLYYDTTSSDLRYQNKENNVSTLWSIEASVSLPFSRAVAVRASGTEARPAIDGVLGSTKTLDAAPSTAFTTLQVGRTGVNQLNGHVRRFTYFPRAISDASLATYTGANPPTIDLDKPTRRWGGITGRSLVDNNALPTTGVLTLAEHYQTKL